MDTTLQAGKTLEKNFEGFLRFACIILKSAAMDSHDPLSRTLKTWKVTPPPSPTFRSAVWQRIEALKRAPGETWGNYLRAHLALWVLVGGVSLLGAGWIGHSAGEVRTAKARELLVTHYVESLDPMAQMRVVSR